MQIVTEIYPQIVPSSFTFGDIKIGDISIDVPDGRSSFETEIDFTATRGFALHTETTVSRASAPPR